MAEWSLWQSIANWLQHNLNNTELVEGLRRARGPDKNLVYYVCETKHGMMAADSELTKQLSSYILLKNSVKFK